MVYLRNIEGMVFEVICYRKYFFSNIPKGIFYQSSKSDIFTPKNRAILSSVAIDGFRAPCSIKPR